MKIGLLHNLYGEFSRGGAETAVALLAGEYRTQGHEVFLLTTRPRGVTDKTGATVRAGEKIYQLPSDFYNLGRRPWLYRAVWHTADLFSFRKYRRIKKILRTEKPDLAVTHNLMGLGFLVPLALRRLKIRHEHFLHDIQLLHPSGLMFWGKEKKIDSGPARIYQALTRFLFASPARVISPSRWLLEMHTRRGFFKNSEKSVRPLVWPAAAIKRTLPTDRVKNFLFIGQIEKQKGVLLLISAFKKISGPDLKLIIANRGGGRDLAAARELAADDRRIEFRGPLSYEETEQIKTVSDCLVVPSLCYENSPTVIYGAHAMGLKVIAANIGGIPEIVGPGDHLFLPGNEEDLIKNLTLTI
jgi:glycosyltransferase involved in cell wall biosynthesis